MTPDTQIESASDDGPKEELGGSEAETESKAEAGVPSDSPQTSDPIENDSVSTDDSADRNPGAQPDVIPDVKEQPVDGIVESDAEVEKTGGQDGQGQGVEAQALQNFEKDVDAMKAATSLLMGQLEAFVQQWLRTGDRKEAAAEVLAALPSESDGVLAETLAAEDVVTLLGLGQSSLVGHVVDSWGKLADARAREREVVERLTQDRSGPLSAAAARVGLKLAHKLAIREPSLSKQMVKSARETISDGDDVAFEGIERRIEVGEVMIGLDSEDHEFWEACLSWDGEEPFSWESQGARERLKKLATCLRGRTEPLPLIQAAVPSCWWDEAIRPDRSNVILPSPWGFSAGLAAGVVLAPLAFIAAVEFAPELGLWWKSRMVRLQSLPVAEQVAVQSNEFSEAPPQLTSDADFAGVPNQASPQEKSNQSPVPTETLVMLSGGPSEEASMNAKESATRESTPVMADEGSDEAKASVAIKPATKSKKASTKPKAPPVIVEKSLHPDAVWRDEELKRIFESHSAVERVHGMICRGTQRENLSLLLGRESVMPAGSEDYGHLMKTLLLEPPPLEEVRRIILRQAARYMRVEDLITVTERLSYAQSPNRGEIMELADLTLALNASGMSQAEVDRIWKAMRKKKQP